MGGRGALCRVGRWGIGRTRCRKTSENILAIAKRSTSSWKMEKKRGRGSRAGGANIDRRDDEDEESLGEYEMLTLTMIAWLFYIDFEIDVDAASVIVSI